MPASKWGLAHGSLSTEKRAQTFVNNLLEDDPTENTSLREFKIASTLFFEKNETFKRAMRLVFKEVLEVLGTALRNRSNLDENRDKLSRCLKLLPLASIKPNERYMIPTELDGDWHMIEYFVTPIELTPTSGYGRLVLKDHDRLFAYGLAPLLKPKQGESVAPTHLIFVDQYPGQQGWLSSLYLRFKHLPSLFRGCQDKIEKWLKDHTTSDNPRNTIVHGLGHASRLALETMFTPQIRKYITSVDVLDTYATSHSTFLTNYSEKWEEIQEKPEVSVQLHKNHYNLGEIMPGWTVKDSSGTELPNNQFMKDAWHNIILGTVLGGILNTLLSSLQYVFVPMIRAIRDHIVELALLSILTMVFLMLPGLIMTDIGTILAVFTAGYFAAQLVQPFRVLLGWNEKTEAECHKVSTQDLEEENAESVRKIAELTGEVIQLSQEVAQLKV